MASSSRAANSSWALLLFVRENGSDLHFESEAFLTEITTCRIQRFFQLLGPNRRVM